MTAADLFAFCQQMMATHENSRINENTLRIPSNRRYTSMDTKAVTTFDGTNYQAWRRGIHVDAEVIGGTDIITKNQHEPPQDTDAL
ncbi:hypothetical protein PABG_12527 [Paracoccidioides brasiliensis Pb03]|nr:hypothetical protein PABG_12527 [Paracoccidioides brasiliensis Pb03]